MRVGVYLGEQPENSGGGTTFQSDIVKAIDNNSFQHDFVLLYQLSTENFSEVTTPLVCLNDYKAQSSETPDSPGLLSRIFSRLFNNKQEIVPEPSVYNTPLYDTQLIDSAVREYNLDIIWFVSPSEFRTTVPYIYTVWDLAHRSIPWFPEVSSSGWIWEGRERHYVNVLPRASRVVVGSKAGKKEVHDYYRVLEENIAVIPFFVPSYCRIKDDESSGTKVLEKYQLNKAFLFYPAQFWPHKNHINILSAVDLLKQEGIDIDMVFTGADKGNEQYVRNTATSIGLQDRVHFLGFVPQEDIPVLYRHAFALLFASVMGPDNIPPLEAFELGCPVISARYNGAEDQLGNAALLFDPEDPEDIAGSIKMLLADTNLRQSMIERGHQRVVHRGTAEYVASVCNLADDLEPVLRCWQSDYTHP